MDFFRSCITGARQRDLDFSALENPKYAQNKLITQFITPRKNAKLTVDIPKSGTKCVKKIKLNE